MNTNGSQAVAAAGDPTRRRILELLSVQAQPVGQLAAQLPVTRPAVSQHLRVLKAAGLVVDRVDGTRRVYQLDPAGLAAVRDYFDAFWKRALANFAASSADQPPTSGPSLEKKAVE